jgi:hypothetical protein
MVRVPIRQSFAGTSKSRLKHGSTINVLIIYVLMAKNVVRGMFHPAERTSSTAIPT